MEFYEHDTYKMSIRCLDFNDLQKRYEKITKNVLCAMHVPVYSTFSDYEHSFTAIGRFV